MKKIILLILIVTVNVCMVQGQQSQGFGANGKILSVDEVNRLNGTPQTTINGKPYSQYKAEQDALKQQAPQQLRSTVSPDRMNPAVKEQQTVPVTKDKPNVKSDIKISEEIAASKLQQAAEVKVQTVQQKTDAASYPALPAGIKLELSNVGPAESKPAEQKATQPAQPSGNLPNGAKTKTN